MFGKLQEKWKINGWRLTLVIATFALGGSLCGYIGRKLITPLELENPVLWTAAYIIVVSLLWPICVLLVSIPLGQFSFFKKYLRKMGQHIFGLPLKSAVAEKTEQANQSNASIPKIAIFASGAGSNAAKIIEAQINALDGKWLGDDKKNYRVALVACNKPGAGVLDIAEKYGIPILLIEKEFFFTGSAYISDLKAAGIDFIVLAGFLWKIPTTLIQAFPNKIVNIHPALLPKYGGKGMYGQRVHEAVIANGETESGITIHWVDEQYDHGSIILQVTCPVLPHDTPETLAQRIHALEHLHYPQVVSKVVANIHH